MEFNLIRLLAGAIGASEPAFRLLFSIILVFPIAWLYRCRVQKDTTPTVKYLFFTVSGLAIGVFNFGGDIYHSILAVLFTFLTLKVFGPSKFTTVLNFAFHMLYLLIGYYGTGTETYDITWTMPHCVLVLRLIGLSFDLWDGTKPAESLSASNRLTALREQPSLLEISAHVFFPAGFLVGPQFSMARLKDFVAGKFDVESTQSCLAVGSKRALIGLTYLFVYQVGILYFPDEYLMSEEYMASSFFKKHLIMGIWGKLTLSKYVSCWLLTEGACITFGLAYNGEDKVNKGVARFDGCRNIDLNLYEKTTTFGGFVPSFNINTNAWVAQYVYKRMAFLGSRQASQLVTLMFLAVWHGLHSGYYMTFFMEFSIIYMEKELESILKKNEAFTKEKSTILSFIQFVVLKLYVIVFMGYCLVPFSLLSVEKWWPVYRSLYFSGFIMFFPWAIAYKPLVRMVIKPTRPKAESATQ